jgi:CheY-like chemotaxis protein
MSINPRPSPPPPHWVLPLAGLLSRSQRAGPTPLTPQVPPRRPTRVLVVDDNQDAADSLAVFLRLTGHEVRTAADGPAALEAAREFRPDGVILDIGLPGLDGCEVARRLRQDPDLAGALLVALTGYALEADRRRCLEAGFDGFLAKPADPQQVRLLLAEARQLS